jgi:hypothetical protein
MDPPDKSGIVTSVLGQAARPRWAAAALFAAAVAISAFSMLRGIDPFDEGLALQAASRVASGELPYGDFNWAYGPGQPYLLAGLSELFGPSLLAWRIVRILVNGAVAVAVYGTLRGRTGRAPALGGALVTAAAMAQPLSANPFAPALLFALAAAAAASADRPRPVAAGALTALAAAWRLDFGVYAGVACLAALALRRDARTAARYTAVSVGGALLAYLPFLVATGPADMWDALVATGLRDREHWTLPFPLEYDGGFSLWPPGTLAHDLKDVLSFYVPVLLVAGFAVAAAAAFVRRRSLPPPWAALLVLAACFVLYLRSRTDPFHETPLLVTLAVLLPLVAAGAGRRVAAPALAVLALLGAYVVANRANALLDPPHLERLHLDVADGVRVEPGEAAALPPAVAAVKELVPADEPIYVVTLRSDLVRVGNPLLYVLAERPNAMDADFDLQTSAADQHRVVERLAEVRPRAIVRWTDPDSARREPNERGEPSGSRLLDEYVDRAYREHARFGHYLVLEPRP